jgi:transglutaminase-like putative cysteine protease
VTSPIHHVGCTVELEVHEPAALAFQVAVAEGPKVDEVLTVTLDGEALDAEALRATHGGRIHRLDVAPGRLALVYRATVVASGEARRPDLGEEVERLLYLRPSRYAPSDRMGGWVMGELGDIEGMEAALAVESWIGEHVAYVLGSSGPFDDATDTMLAGQGVCRDFAHLGVAMCRALDVPARLVAVYAPGLDPMDFHAVFEAHVDGAWHVFDATRLAPRSSLLRIATGRDAADTAFLSSYQGRLDLLTATVTAVVDGALPWDDRSEPAILP